VRRRRQGERGAALFIVMMVVVLLSAVGVYAVRAASLLEMASGYERKAAQALYIGEFGMRVVAGDIAGKEDDYKKRITDGGTHCEANKNLVLPAGNNKPCYWVDQQEMSSRVTNYSTALNLSDANVQGLLGRVIRQSQSSTATADFRVEITDIGPAPKLKEGTDIASDNFKHRQVTFTTIGQIRPAGAACTTGTLEASSVQGVRSHVTFMSVN
jgi:Tfp pilus assembly protein PilX